MDYRLLRRGFLENINKKLEQNGLNELKPMKHKRKKEE